MLLTDVCPCGCGCHPHPNKICRLCREPLGPGQRDELSFHGVRCPACRAACEEARREGRPSPHTGPTMDAPSHPDSANYG